jgi:starch-binding outer membrane protein, SusD/RagB family
MKKYIKIFAILLLLFPACNEEILDKNPLDRYSDPVVWSDINLARSYLNPIYNNVDWGFSQRGHGYQTDIFTIELVLTKGGQTVEYNSGLITADNTGGSYRGHANWHRFSQIQQLNIFLANIDRVPEEYPESEKESIKAEANVLKGEALMLRALFYSELCRNYGGIPLFNEPHDLNDDFSIITRASFEETINFIVKDLDEATQLLEFKSEMEMGRVTKEFALALKSRMLIFAASDLTADGTANNEIVGYSNPDRTALWTAARNSAKAVMDVGTCELADFGAPDQEAVATNYFEFFKAYDLSDKEVIWGRMHRKDVGYRIQTNLRNGPNGNNNWGNNGPTGNHVDSYEMSDGTKFFNHFTINENNEYINTSSVFPNENPYSNREPRFYASILYDSAVWQPRFANLVDIDPVGIYDRRTRIVKENGQVVSERFGLDSRQGPVENWNAGYSGYLLKKFMDDQVIGRDEYNENISIYMRYAEIILNYAEACLELNDVESATTYINMIRNRAGLPDFTGDITEALRHERRMELFAENLYWYDVRRWKILNEVLEPMPYGVDITEITNNGEKTTTWKRIRVQPDNNFVEKLYWIPIPTDEINRAPQLIQNPGY